jgi:hypothetical protein
VRIARPIAILTAIVATTALTAAAAPAYSSPTPGVSGDVYYLTDEETPDGPHPVSDLPASVRAQLTGNSTRKSEHGPIGTLAKDTPRGYKLRGNNKLSNFLYKTDWMTAKWVHCKDGVCTTKQKIKFKMHQSHGGETAKRWKLTAYYDHISGSRSFKGYFSYECGVNIPREKDKTCSTHFDDDADGPDDMNRMSHEESLYKKWGNKKSTKKFPMVKFDIQFANGTWGQFEGDYGMKMRGWDTCINARGRAKLCPATGTGG